MAEASVPNGISVFDAVESELGLKLVKQKRTIPVIVVSSRTPVGNKEAALKGGAVAYLQKPVDIDALLRAIREALGISEADASANQA